ncbi:MAG: hypothetical protein AAGU77_07535, partial [Bacillota bacterium]
GRLQEGALYKQANRVLTAAFLALLSAIFAYWIFTAAAGYTAASVICAGLTALLFGLLGIRCIYDFLYSISGAPEQDLTANLGRRSLRRAYRHPVAALFLFVVLVRLLVFALAYAMLVLQKGYTGGLVDTLGLWIKGDAPHYLGIAERWYVTEGDPRFHIVFFPLYPLLVRLVNALLHNTFASGLFSSLVCTAGAGVLLYELALLDFGRAGAKRAVAFQMLLPAAFLLSAPMSDGLFLLLSIAVVLLARKKRYVFAALIGGLAAFTRVLGILLLIPVAIELWGEAARVRARGERALRYALPRAAALLLIPLGLAGYLYVNYAVTGDAFTFLVYQREHWSQRMGWFFDTAAYQTDYLLKTFFTDRRAAFGLWLPNLAFLLLTPLAVLLAARPARKVKAAAPDKPAPAEESAPEAAEAVPETDMPESGEAPPAEALAEAPPPAPEAAEPAPEATEPVPEATGSAPEIVAEPTPAPRLRASYTAYFLAYYLIGMGATWLLSAPRYLTCCFPVSIALAALAQKRTVAWPLYALLLIAQLAYLWAYVAGWPVY